MCPRLSDTCRECPDNVSSPDRDIPYTTRQTLSTVWERGIHGAGSRSNALGLRPLSSSIISVRTGWETSDDWQGDDRDSAYFVKSILVNVLTSDSLEVIHGRFKVACHKVLILKKRYNFMARLIIAWCDSLLSVALLLEDEPRNAIWCGRNFLLSTWSTKSHSKAK